jgi:hypothetical protein
LKTFIGKDSRIYAVGFSTGRDSLDACRSSRLRDIKGASPALARAWRLQNPS